MTLNYVSDIEGYGFYRDAATSTVMMTPAYAVNVQETEHGAVTVNKNCAVPGNTVTVTIAPEEGYRLREGGVTLTCEGEDGVATALEYEVIDETRFRFVMPDAPVTVAVEFEPLPHEHEWGEAIYTWSEDYASVVASRVCLRDETHVETETVAATSAVSLPATCETVGETTYTSEAFENTAFEAQTLMLADIPALGHEWSETTYTWSED